MLQIIKFICPLEYLRATFFCIDPQIDFLLAPMLLLFLIVACH